MSNPSLSSIANDVVEQYHQAGRSLVAAYKSGVGQAERKFNASLAKAGTDPVLPLANESVRASLIEVQRQFASALAKGLREGSDRVAELNDRLAERAKGDIGRLVESASGVDASTAETLALFALPSAQLSLAVANAVSEGAKRIAERVEAASTVVAAEVVDADVAPRKSRAKRAA